MAKILPFIATRGIVVLPYTQIKIEIGRQKSIEALEYAIENKTDIIITTQLDPDLDEPKFKDINKYATIAQIVKARKNKDGDYNITLLGKKIVKLEGHDNDDELSTMAKYSEIDEK
ncbi:LON peptidase substrate-binding domain-containing protein [bacterium]|nr:LON peptidase substrate-binding domain-containing protein [bacterium]